MKIVWTSDVHFDHASDEAVTQFLDRVSAENPDILLIGGDIAEAPTISAAMAKVAATNITTYFVLGNHDFYRGSFEHVEAKADNGFGHENLKHLTKHGPVCLKDGTFLCGAGGWGDGRSGVSLAKSVRVSDWFQIEDLFNNFVGFDFYKLSRAIESRGIEEAGRLKSQLLKIPDYCKKIVILTHVPPFPEAAWYDGSQSDNRWLPSFVCVSTGHVIYEFALKSYASITVYCGHTHGSGTIRPLENLTVITGCGSEYGEPDYRCI